jgi:hypothetical protein
MEQCTDRLTILAAQRYSVQKATDFLCICSNLLYRWQRQLEKKFSVTVLYRLMGISCSSVFARRKGPAKII